MSRLDRPSEVDFDVSPAEPDPDFDEVLVEPPDRLPWLTRQVRLVLTLVCVVAVAAVLVVQAGRSGFSTPTAAPEATVTAPPSATPVIHPAPPLDPTPTVAVAPGSAAYCPQADDGLSLCSTSTLVPAAALSAVTRHFPGATIESKFEEDLRDVGYGSGGLWYRRIRASLGSSAIVVELRKRRATDRAVVTFDENVSRDVVLDRVVTRTLTIVVRVTTAAGRFPALHPLRALARDVHLRAPVA